MAISCDPNSLANAARCFTGCIPAGGRRAVKSYLLCQIANVGLVGGNIVPAGATCQAGSYTLNVKANTTYQITWGSETSVNICGAIYASTGQGTAVVVFTGACTTMVFACGSGAITTQVRPVNKTPVPPGFALGVSGGNDTASWTSMPGFATATEVWTSSDNITFALFATVASPTLSANLGAPVVGTPLYAKARFVAPSGTPNPGPFSATKYLNGTVGDWVKRVIANGGATPSQATIDAQNTFVDATVTAAIHLKLEVTNSFVPDNLIAAITPLYKRSGNDPWTNSGFVLANLSVNGLIADGTKTLDTGINPQTLYGNNTNLPGAWGLYNMTASNEFTIDFGAQNATGGTAMSMYIDFGGTTFTDCWASSGTGRISAANGLFTGFLAASRTDGTHLTSYIANSGTPFQVLASNAAGGSNGAQPNFNMIIFGYQNNGAVTPQSNKRFSFAFIANTGLTSTEMQALFNAVQALRTALGGGFV